MKYTVKEPKKDNRIFKKGFIISQSKIQNIYLVKIPKKCLVKSELYISLNLFLNWDGNIKDITNDCFFIFEEM